MADKMKAQIKVDPILFGAIYGISCVDVYFEMLENDEQQSHVTFVWKTADGLVGSRAFPMEPELREALMYFEKGL